MVSGNELNDSDEEVLVTKEKSREQERDLNSEVVFT